MIRYKISLNSCHWEMQFIAQLCMTIFSGKFLLPFVVVLLLKERDWFIEGMPFIQEKIYMNIIICFFEHLSAASLMEFRSSFSPSLCAKEFFYHMISFMRFKISKKNCLFAFFRIWINSFTERKRIFFIKNRKKKHEWNFLTL